MDIRGVMADLEWMACRRALPWIVLLLLATGCGLDSAGIVVDGSVGEGSVVVQAIHSFLHPVAA